MNDEETMDLSLLDVGSRAVITEVEGSGELRQHLLDMGMIPSVEVLIVKRAPLGDPVEVRIHDYELTLRLSDLRTVRCVPVPPDAPRAESPGHEDSRCPHPGLGEKGTRQWTREKRPEDSGRTLRFALVGNQNSGKTTLFNQLTGSNQHVGNFPGVTVDRKEGPIRGQKNAFVTDLPGIYSMSPYSPEERITRKFVLDEKPDGIINIVDATNMERNLYLTMQLIELGIPMVLALNMMDEVRENGGSVRVNELEEELGIPVVPISASKNEGVDELVEHAMNVAYFRESPVRRDFCSPQDKGGAVHRCLHGLRHLLEDHAERCSIPVAFAASKVAEGDGDMIRALGFDENESHALEHIVRQMEKESGLDRASAIADMRYSFIFRAAERCMIRPKVSKERERSRRIDRVLTGKWTAIPIFVLIMALVFFLTFNVIGQGLSDVLAYLIGLLSDSVSSLMESLSVNEAVRSLVVDAVIGGVGAVIGFLPIIVCLFMFLSILEDSGYMARVAFVMDRALRRIGLSGRSIVPMLIGFGCTVPGVMASRTLPSERDRKITILITPFMSCSAKLPIYAFFTDAFFPEHKALVMTGLYFGGIVIAVLAASLLRKTVFKGDAVPFVMELPNYRMPGARNVMMLLWEKCRDFLTRAFTVIFVSTIVIWFLENFSFSLNMVSDPQESMLAVLSGFIAPLFSPLGFGDWRMATALISGFMAKESVVMTLSVLFGSVGAMQSALGPMEALSFLVFSLLYTPCVAAVASIKREMGSFWALMVVFGNLLVAWLFSFLVYFTGSLFL